jgi:hypothetical protein
VGRRPATERAIEIRAPRGRAAFDDDQAVRREDDRRDLAAELLGRLQPCPVQARPLRGPGVQDDVDLERRPAAGAGERDSRAFSPEADQARIGARAGREALGADVQRLEQVRLAGPVRADDEYEPRLQPELEAGVRAEISQ